MKFKQAHPGVLKRSSILAWLAIFMYVTSGCLYFETEPTIDVRQVEAGLVELRVSTAKSKDLFGGDLAATGDLLFVAAPGRTVDGMKNSGAVDIIRRVGDDFAFHDTIVLEAGLNHALFGFHIEANQDWVVASCFGCAVDDVQGAGKVFIYHNTEDFPLHTILTPPNPELNGEFGGLLELEGDRLFISETTSSRTGRVHVAAYSSGAWGITQTLEPGPQNGGSAFGATLEADGNLLMVAAPFYEEQGNKTGAIFVYEAQQGSYRVIQELPKPGLEDGTFLGYGMELYDGTLAAAFVAWPGTQNESSGLAFYKVRSNGTWGPAEAWLFGQEGGEAAGAFLAWWEETLWAAAANAVLDGHVIGAVGTVGPRSPGDGIGYLYAPSAAWDVQFGYRLEAWSDWLVVSAPEGDEEEPGRLYVYTEFPL